MDRLVSYSEWLSKFTIFAFCYRFLLLSHRGFLCYLLLASFFFSSFLLVILVRVSGLRKDDENDGCNAGMVSLISFHVSGWHPWVASQVDLRSSRRRETFSCRQAGIKRKKEVNRGVNEREIDCS